MTVQLENEKKEKKDRSSVNRWAWTLGFNSIVSAIFFFFFVESFPIFGSRFSDCVRRAKVGRTFLALQCNYLIVPHRRSCYTWSGFFFFSFLLLIFLRGGGGIFTFLLSPFICFSYFALLSLRVFFWLVALPALLFILFFFLLLQSLRVVSHLLQSPIATLETHEVRFPLCPLFPHFHSIASYSFLFFFLLSLEHVWVNDSIIFAVGYWGLFDVPQSSFPPTSILSARDSVATGTCGREKELSTHR